MGKISLSVLIVFLMLTIVSLSAQSENEIEKALKLSVEYKVERMKGIIKFSDSKSERIKSIELDYLLDVYKAEKCFMCNKSKRIKRLKTDRDEKLQDVLERDEYIKYNSLEYGLIQNVPVQLE